MVCKTTCAESSTAADFALHDANPGHVSDLAVRSLVEKKRDGSELSPSEWTEVVAYCQRGASGEPLLAALLMACVLNGMSATEIVSLTKAMVQSGSTMSFSTLKNVFDKHSTGGVGDTASLIVVPLLAACGEHVAKLSGRALGHTGGTLDKLQSVPGLQVHFSPAAFQGIVADVGCCIAAQSAHFVPADKILYALRDKTGTVPSLGLITSSIVSKKIAAGGQYIVYDVKVGSGAFLKTLPEARALGEMLVGVTAQLGRHSTAVITDMNQPLCPAVGEGLEVIAARDFLSGADRPVRLAAVVEALMLAALRMRYDGQRAEAMTREALNGYRGLNHFEQMIAAQGGDLNSFLSARPLLEALPARALRGGYVCQMDLPAIGNFIRKVLATSGPMAGVVFCTSLGDFVARGQSVAIVHGANAAMIAELEGYFRYSDDPPAPVQTVYERTEASADSASSTLSIK